MSTAADPMAQLRERFLLRLAEQEALLVAYNTKENLPELRRACHQIAGAGGMFGYADLSAAASVVEEAIDAGKCSAALDPPLAELLGRVADALHTQLR